MQEVGLISRVVRPYTVHIYYHLFLRKIRTYLDLINHVQDIDLNVNNNLMKASVQVFNMNLMKRVVLDEVISHDTSEDDYSADAQFG